MGLIKGSKQMSKLGITIDNISAGGGAKSLFGGGYLTSICVEIKSFR